MKLGIQWDARDYCEDTKEGKITRVCLRVNVRGIMRMIEDTLRRPQKDTDFNFLLGEYAKYWVMAQAGIKEYPLSRKKKRAEGG